ncbi:MAG: hypothetical protein ACRERC_02585 [Candidatus Binatia bacterium]
MIHGRDELIPEQKERLKQFVIGPGLLPGDGFAERIRLGDYTVGLFPGLRCHRVLEPEGRCIGLFLGHVFDYANRRRCEGDLRVDGLAGLDSLARARRLEDFAFGFGGRWVFLHIDDIVQRIYLDADGCESLIYDPSACRAASTTGLLLDDVQYAERFDAELYEALGVSGAGWFPSGLTAHRGIRRLLCNHFLDLSTWRPRRHWPKADVQWTADPHGHYLRIAELVRLACETIFAGHSASITLTAGNESRLLLAACRDIAADIEFITVNVPGAEMDVDIAARLAARFGLRHRILPARRASPAEETAWRYASSHCLTGMNMHYHPTIEPLRSKEYFLGGLGGEVARAWLWRPGDHETSQLDAGMLVSRLGMPVHPRVVEATEAWLESVRPFNALTQLDLAYLELRMSAWAFAQSYAQDAIVDHLHPMICREVYQLMLELPPEAKRQKRFIPEGVEALWPELLELPINRYGDARDRTA